MEKEVFTELMKLFSRRYGPIVEARKTYFKKFSWWLYTYKLARPTSKERIWLPIKLGASGTSTKQDEALTRSLGEAVERHTAINFDYASNVKYIDANHKDSLFRLCPRCLPQENCPDSFKSLSE